MYDKVDCSGETDNFLGVDVGRAHDFTVLTVVSTSGADFSVKEIKILRETPYEQQLQCIKELNERYHFRKGYVDSTGIGNMLAEYCHTKVSALISGYQFTEQSKAALFNNLIYVVNNNRLFVEKSVREDIINDLGGITRVVTENGGIRFQSDYIGQSHSDIATSIALAVKAGSQIRVQGFLPQTGTFRSKFL